MKNYIKNYVKRLLRESEEPQRLSLSDVLTQYKEYGDIQNISLPEFTDQERWVFKGMLGMIDELRQYKITSSEYSNTDNWGIKPNGNLGLFDIGFGDYFDDFDEEPKNLDLNESTLLDRIKNRMDINQPSTYLGGGMFGKAHDLGDGRVLKITKDKSEAINSKRIQGKDMQYLANIYDVRQFISDNDRKYFVILLEKLDTSHSFDAELKSIQNKFELHRTSHIEVEVINQIQVKHPEIAQFLNDLVTLGYSSGWEKLRERGHIDMELPYELDWNDIADISVWIANSVENDNTADEDVPHHVEEMVKLLTQN